MIGGEQYIRIPTELDDESKYSNDELCAFFIHAFCNAAGMFNEQQRIDRDEYVDIYWNNIKSECVSYFYKESKNFKTLGYFDYNSITLASSTAYSKNGNNTITLASSTAYSKNGNNTITKKGGGTIAKNLTLSSLDISFLNDHYLPYIARTDNYIELDTVVYHNDKKLTDSERIELQQRINEQRGLYGDPPINGRIKREPW